MRIYLIRHGQTDWNIQGKIQGSCNIPLNETGRRQARQLAEGMEARPVAKLFSSTLVRAMETAEAVSQRQGVGIIPLDSLIEIGFGKWEGMTNDEILEAYPKEYTHWCLNPGEAAPPGGESLREVTGRCKTAVKEILRTTGGREDAAVVSHGATIVHLISCMVPEAAEAGDIIVENASITTINYNPLTEDFVLLQLNDTSHLA